MWGRGLTAVGPGQVPGAADVHEGAWGPIRPAGIVIEGPVAEEVWCRGKASESEPGWGAFRFPLLSTGEATQQKAPCLGTT